MAKFKMAAASLCLLLALLQATQIHAVVNKGSVSSGPSKDGPSETDANDRISNSYGPPRLNDVYGPPDSSGPPRFHGPAPAYGPPPSAPVYGPPPPPPPRKPKPHYGPPKPQYGPPKPQYGPPKPQYGPPKQQYGPPIFEGPPPPPPGQKYGPPLKIRNQYGPPKNGHGPPIPISIETYGPPNKEPSLPFNLPQDNYGPPPPPPVIQHPQIQIRPVQQEYGAPLEIPSPPPGVPAPPTPPDIKYDGWQPIAGLVGTPPDGGHSGYSLSSSSSSSLSSSSSYSSSHSSSGSLDISGGDGFHSEALVGARYPIGNVPSDSYGTPIHSAEAQDLKSSVQQSSSSADSHGLPPPALPTYEEHSNSDGYSGGIGVSSHATSSQLDQYHQHLEQEQQQQLHQPQQQYGIPGLTNEPSVQYGSPDPEPISIIKTVAFELLPTNGGHQESSGSSFGSSSSSDSFSINGGGISLPPPPPPSDSYGLPHGSAGGNSLGTDFQSLSIGGSSGYSSDSSSSSHGLLSGGDLVLPPPPPSSHHPTDSYGAPPPSSYSPNGPYPSSQGIRNSGSFQSSSSFGSNFHKQHSSGHHRHVHRPHGPSFRHGPPPPPPGAFIPPRNRPPVKFRNQIPPGVISALRQYDIPPQSGSGKPFKAYGAPSIHGGSSGGRQQQTLSSSSHQFSSGGGFFGSGSFGSNSAFAAPNVNYGTPLSFTEFNTPAPVLTYGAPNFGADANSFISNSGSFGSGLYSSLGGNALTTTYGTPIVQHQPHHDCSAGSQKTNQVSFGSSSSDASSSGFSNNFASFGNSYDAGSSGANLNLNVGNFYDTPAVNVLTLQNHQQPNVDLKDSYGNPIGVTYGTPDQAVAALTSNDIHISSGSSSSSSSASSLSSSNNFNNQFQVNSISYPSGNYLNDAVSAEALTAALTAQGFGEAKHSESIGVDASRYLQTHEGSEALALAQGLTATGTDGFQIQGSKGIYSLQIQPADGGLGTENSDGSIRHEQVLSNGLLQDILAAIEQPQNGRVEIQGSPQIQNLEEIYGDLAHAASGNVYNGQQHEQQHDITLLESVVQQTLNNVEAKSANVGTESEEHNEEKSDIASEDSDVSASGKDEVALFFNNNYEDSKKEGRSLETSESESSKADESE